MSCDELTRGEVIYWLRIISMFLLLALRNCLFHMVNICFSGISELMKSQVL